MKRILMLFALVLLTFTSANAQPSDWQQVEKIFGKKGNVQHDMIKITFPRSDLTVKMDDVTIEPGLAFSTWIGFRKMGAQAVMMGDMVLLEGEVAPVMAKLVAEKIKITALHNHLIKTKPAVMYLHFSGAGNAEKLAGIMVSALSLTKTPMGSSEPAVSPETPADWSKVEAVFGKKGQVKGKVLQMSFPRREKIRERGMEVPAYLGEATAINFQMAGDKVAAAGDFVLVANEVNLVITTLIEHGIAVTAVHNHMLFESPRLFFLHFWGYDAPEKVAEGLKAALDKTNVAK